MNRRAIPSFEMSQVGQEALRREGVVVTTLTESLAQDPRRLVPHYHDFFQLMFFQGSGAVMHDFRDYRVKGATLMFLSPGQVHTIRPTTGFSAVIVSFSQSFFDHTSAPPSELFSLPFFFPSEASPLLPLPRRDAASVEEVFAAMKTEYREAQARAGEVLRAWLKILFARVFRLWILERPESRPSRQSGLAREFQLAVERGFREERSLGAYARDLGVTANHLNDVLREETGRSAGSLIRRRRLLDAKRLLSHSDLSVAEIGYVTGFRDPSYFGRFFRKETGVSPAEFRAEIREKYHPKGS